MFILETVIIGLVLLLLYGSGWLYKILQLLIGMLLNFGKSLMSAFIQDQLEPPKERKKAREKTNKTIRPG